MGDGEKGGEGIGGGKGGPSVAERAPAAGEVDGERRRRGPVLPSERTIVASEVGGSPPSARRPRFPFAFLLLFEIASRARRITLRSPGCSAKIARIRLPSAGGGQREAGVSGRPSVAPPGAGWHAGAGGRRPSPHPDPRWPCPRPRRPGRPRRRGGAARPRGRPRAGRAGSEPLVQGWGVRGVRRIEGGVGRAGGGRRPRGLSRNRGGSHVTAGTHLQICIGDMVSYSSHFFILCTVRRAPGGAVDPPGRPRAESGCLLRRGVPPGGGGGGAGPGLGSAAGLATRGHGGARRGRAPLRGRPSPRCCAGCAPRGASSSAMARSVRD